MDSVLNHYIKSGEILTNAMNLALKLVEPEARFITIAEKVEKFIRTKGAKPAFPVNISVNEIAAHYSPVINDDLTIPHKSIVKIDLGVEVNGYITDAARTKIFDDGFKTLQNSAILALKNALSIAKFKIHVLDIGSIVEKTIKNDGFNPVVNLSGHSLGQYSLHDGLSIPNHSGRKNRHNKNNILLKNKAYAIEPFATPGKGYVVDKKPATIFRQYNDIDHNNLSAPTFDLYSFIKKELNGLPFSPRWLYNEGYNLSKIKNAMKELIKKNVVHGYAILKEITNKPVSQAEDTIFVKENETLILTRKRKKRN